MVSTNISFIDVSLTWSGIEPTKYNKHGEHANHYTTDVVKNLWKYVVVNNPLVFFLPILVHT
jgi:hypothetical protein